VQRGINARVEYVDGDHGFVRSPVDAIEGNKNFKITRQPARPLLEKLRRREVRQLNNGVVARPDPTQDVLWRLREDKPVAGCGRELHVDRSTRRQLNALHEYCQEHAPCDWRRRRRETQDQWLRVLVKCVGAAVAVMLAANRDTDADRLQPVLQRHRACAEQHLAVSDVRRNSSPRLKDTRRPTAGVVVYEPMAKHGDVGAAPVGADFRRVRIHEGNVSEDGACERPVVAVQAQRDVHYPSLLTGWRRTNCARIAHDGALCGVVGSKPGPQVAPRAVETAADQIQLRRGVRVCLHHWDVVGEQ